MLVVTTIGFCRNPMSGFVRDEHSYQPRLLRVRRKLSESENPHAARLTLRAVRAGTFIWNLNADVLFPLVAREIARDTGTRLSDKVFRVEEMRGDADVYTRSRS